MPIINGETEEPLPPKQLRHCLISVEHETDFLWLNTKNPEYTSSATPFMENFSDEFSSFPMIFVKRNEAWVRTYTTNFNTSLHDDRYFSASVFSTVEEQVAWNVTGFLLAWRVTLAPHEGSVEYRAGQKNIS